MALLVCLLISCWNCHRDIAERYAATPMANSSGTVRAAAEPEGALVHRASQTRYVIRRESGELRLRWNGGSVPLTFFIGSRRMGRSYAFLENGYMYQAPVGYYANKRSWDMAPGYHLDRKPDLDRPITPECLFCHATGARAERKTLNRIIDWRELHGIGCDRCHGDGTQHSAAPRRDNIVNPARLRGSLQSAVCEQCHLAGEARVVMPGKNVEAFRPGEELSDYVDVFVSQDSTGVRVNGHAEALARSGCAQSERLWCGTCHNPHERALDHREKCLTCHGAGQCPSAAVGDGNCVTCHMPKATAYDGGHTVFTDHSIPRRRAPQRERGQVMALEPFYRRPLPASVASRNAGMAYASVGALGKAWPLLRAAVQNGSRDAALHTQVALLLEADGRIGQAIDFYRLSIETDAEQGLALARLGALLAARGESGEAKRLLEFALIRNPRQPAVKKALAALP